jgi:hypothetical protein
MSGSRSNITATSRQPSPSRSSAVVRPTARASVAWITLNAMSDGAAIVRRLASALSCAAARTSVIWVEIAARSRSASRGDVEGEDLASPGAGGAGDGGGKGNGRDGHAGGRCVSAVLNQRPALSWEA